MKLTKKCLTFSALICLVAALSFQLVWHKPLQSSAYALSKESVTVTNGSFNTSPTSYYLDSTPTGWSLIKEGVNCTSGVINTNTEKFNNYVNTYNLSANPETKYKDSSDTKVLMINAKCDENPNGAVNQGYRSNEITLDAYGYYSFSVLAKAELGAVGSIYLNGLDDTLKFENISSTSWKEYNFFVETGSQTEKISFELWLGNNTSQTTSNAMFFDNVTASKLSSSEYNEVAVTNERSKEYTIANDYVTSFENSDFETGNANGWEPISAFPIQTYHKVINTENTEVMNPFKFLGSDNVSGKYALWLASENVPSASFGYKSSTVTLPAFAMYKVSFNAIVDTNTTATVVLKETDKVANLFEEGYYTPQTSTLTVNSNDADNVTMNNYRTYSFYVKGHSLFDSEFYLELYLGTEEEAKSGSVLFDNFTIEKLTTATFEDASSDSYNAKLELKTTTGSLSVDNGNFNDGSVEDINVSYPYSPSEWTVAKNENVAGVINTNTNLFNSYKDNIGDLANPGNPQGFLGTDNEYNNVLMLWNNNNSYQSVTSSKINLTPFDGKDDSYYKLSFDYKNLPSNSELVNFNLTLLDQNGNKIYEKQNINSTTWTKFELVIQNGFYTESVQIKFSLGTENNKASGYLFIDNVTLDKVSEMTEEQFKQAPVKVNFKNAYLNSESLMTDGVYELLGFTGKVESEQVGGSPLAESGVVNSTENKFNIINNNENANAKMMYIQTFANAKYTLTSNFDFELEENKQYLVKFLVRTDISQVDEEYKEKYGLSLELAGTGGNFQNIKTDGEWKEYNIVVNVTDTVKQAKFKFTATSQNVTTGLYFVNGITVDVLEDGEYNTLFQENSTNKYYNFVGETDLPEEDEEETTQPTDNNFNWLIIPSLITSLALVIALVGFVIRRINFKKYQKKIKTEYDRKKTLYQDVIRKQAQEMRDNELKELNVELKNLEAEIATLENEHKEMLSNQRKEKGKKIDKQVEKSFKAYASKHTSLENKKEKLVDKIKYKNSSDYLLELQKKINLDMVKNLKEENAKLANKNDENK